MKVVEDSNGVVEMDPRHTEALTKFDRMVEHIREHPDKLRSFSMVFITEKTTGGFSYTYDSDDLLSVIGALQIAQHDLVALETHIPNEDPLDKAT